MHGMLKSMFAVGMLLAAPAAAVAVPITGDLQLVGDGGVSFGGGTATQAIFTAYGMGAVTAGNQSGSFAILAPCPSCVTFGGPGAGLSPDQTQYTYGPVVSTTGTGTSDVTYTHSPVSGLPLFALNDLGVMSSFTPAGPITIDKVTSVIAGRSSTAYLLSAVGTLTLTGFDDTEGMFSITTQGASTFASFSASADAAPAPLAGAGLLSFAGAGLVGLRKRSRRLIGRLSSRLAAA